MSRQHTGLQSTQTRSNYSSNNTGMQGAQTRASSNSQASLHRWLHCMSNNLAVFFNLYALPAIGGHGEIFSVYVQYIFCLRCCRKCMDAIERLVFTAAAAVIVDAAIASNFA